MQTEATLHSVSKSQFDLRGEATANFRVNYNTVSVSVLR